MAALLLSTIPVNSTLTDLSCLLPIPMTPGPHLSSLTSSRHGQCGGGRGLGPVGAASLPAIVSLGNLPAGATITPPRKFRDLPEPVRLPDCVIVPGTNILQPL